MKKERFNFLEPKVIMSAVVALIFITIGIFSVAVINSEQQSSGYVSSYEGVFPIINPTVNQSLNTEQSGMTGVTVTQLLNDGRVITIPLYGYIYSGTIVTVDHRCLYGE